MALKHICDACGGQDANLVSAWSLDGVYCRPEPECPVTAPPTPSTFPHPPPTFLSRKNRCETYSQGRKVCSRAKPASAMAATIRSSG